MARLSARLRPSLVRNTAALAVAMVALGANWLWAPAAVGVTFAAMAVAVRATITFNVLQTRLLASAVVFVHGAAIALASGSVALGAAIAIPIVLTLPGEISMRRLGYKSAYLFPIFLVATLGAVGVAWPAGSWGWAAVPGLLYLTFLAVLVPRDVLDMKRHTPACPLTVGEPVASFRCLARDGTSFDLEGERGHYVLLCFLRGDWCPVCQVMMRVYRREAALLARHGVKLVAASPLGGQDAVDFAKDMGIEYTILVDEGGKLARQFGAVHPKGDPNGGDTMLPASFLIDGAGILRAVSRADDLSGYFAPQRVLQAIEPRSEAA